MSILTQKFSDISLKRKLNVIVLATTFLALGIAYSAFISYDISDVRNAKIQSLRGLAKLIGYGCAAALSFEDEHDAAETLQSLSTLEDVEDAAIFYPDGRILAKYCRKNNSDSLHCIPALNIHGESIQTDADYLLMTLPIASNGGCIGYVFLKTDTSDLFTRLQRFITIAVVLALISLLVAFAFSTQLQRVISGPILDLARVTRTVRESRDYSIRAVSSGQDEIGTLVDGFNDMLAEIQYRDFDLISAHAELETRADQLQSELGERQRAEREAEQMRTFLQNVLDSMPSIVIAVNAQGQVTQWNTEAEKAALLPRTAALGMNISEAFPALKLNREIMQAAVSSGRPERWEKMPLRLADEERIFDVVIYPMSFSGVEGVVVRVDDITEHVRMEEMMIQTEKMMSVGGLAAGMAHEINNPLGIIVQSAQNMLRRVSPDLKKNQEAAEKIGVSIDSVKNYLDDRGIFQFLDDINAAGKRAANIVSNMLNFSRRTESEHNPVDMADLLRRSVELAANDYDLKKKYDFRHIQINWELDPAMPQVPCVETKIEQVLLNLLKNSAQALGIHGCPSGEPRITCRTYQQDQFAVIEIEDNGPGMPENIRRRIFEPFFTTKEVGTGTGLGLSVSYFIITDNHQGQLECESSEGNGAKFIIRLPLADTHSAHMHADHNSSTTSSST